MALSVDDRGSRSQRRTNAAAKTEAMFGQIHGIPTVDAITKVTKAFPRSQKGS